MHNNEVALVTGANQGIGLEIAKTLAAKGLTVLLGSRDPRKGEAAAKGLKGDVRAIQLDVTDRRSIAQGAARISQELGRLNVLVNNAAISHTQAMAPGQTVEQWAAGNKASNCSIDEVKAVWDANVFGALFVYQAVFGLLKKGSRVVNVSSLVGSLTAAADPKNQYRQIFGPGYSASKTAMNAMSLCMAIECEPLGIKVNACSPGFTKTNLNGFQGTETVEQGAAEAVRLALLGADGPTGTFSHATMGILPW